MNQMVDADIKWVAGIIEGEGCFTINNKNGKVTPSVRISVGMTDEDVIRSLHEMTGVGTVVFRRRQKENWKDSWIWRVSARQAVLDLGYAVLPFMYERRSLKLLEVLALCEELDARRPEFDVCQLPGCNNPLTGKNHLSKYCIRKHKVYHGIIRYNERQKIKKAEEVENFVQPILLPWLPRRISSNEMV